MAGRMWKAFGLASALTTAVLVRRAIEVFWKVGTGREPPANPEDPDVEWKEAVAFALASGAAAQRDAVRQRLLVGFNHRGFRGVSTARAGGQSPPRPDVSGPRRV